MKTRSLVPFTFILEVADFISDTEEAESSSGEDGEESSSDEELGARVQQALKDCKCL